MKERRAVAAFLVSVCIFVLVASPWAQGPVAPHRFGLVQDWSQGHILFSRDGLMKKPGLISSEPRIVHQATLRWRVGSQELPEDRSASASMAGQTAISMSAPLLASRRTFNPWLICSAWMCQRCAPCWTAGVRVSLMRRFFSMGKAFGRMASPLQH